MGVISTVELVEFIENDSNVGIYFGIELDGLKRNMKRKLNRKIRK